MRSVLSKLSAVALAALLVFGFFAITPAASAQDYAPTPPQAVPIAGAGDLSGLLAAIQAANAANAGPTAASVPASGAGAAGADGAALAFTGSEVNVPLAAGALLIGAGGLVLLAARKREQSS